MQSKDIEGLPEANRAIDAYRTPRFYDLDMDERWVETTQYAGRPGFWTNDCPLWERQPLLAYPIVKAATESNGDLLFDAPPSLTDRNVEPGDEEASEARSTLFSELVDECDLWSAVRESYETAQGARTAVLIGGVRNGALFIDSTRAKWCEPEFALDGTTVERLVIQYGYTKRELDPRSRKWRWVGMLYRREIDGTTDSVFSAKAKEDGGEPEWSEVSSTAHGFTRCPVIWYAFMRGISMVDDIDGRNIHAHLHDEIEAHDFSFSQRHRSALFCGEPQIVEVGVQPGYSPTETVRGFTGGYSDPMDVGSSDAAGTVVGKATLGQGSGGARLNAGGKGGTSRKRGPGTVWQYSDKDVKVTQLTLAPGALDAIDGNTQDLRVKLAEGLAVVFLDPENVKFASTTSGKALAVLRKRQLDRVAKHAADLERRLVIPLATLLLEILAAVMVTNKQLVAALAAVGPDIRIGLDWPGDEADAEEEAKRSETARNDLDAGIILTETAVRHVAPTYDIDNVPEYLVALEAEAEKKAEAAVKANAELMHGSPFADDDEDPKADRAGRGAGPPDAPGDGSGSPVGAPSSGKGPDKPSPRKA